MGKVTEQMILNFFLAKEKELTLEELSGHFTGIQATELVKLVNNLVAKKLLDENPLQLSWSLSYQARILMKANPKPLKRGYRHSTKKPKEYLYTGWVAWIAILLALGLALLALGILLIKFR
jgi:hypothetical protein